MADITGYPYNKLPGGWEDDVLNSLQAPVTVGNVHFLDSWEMFEQGNPATAATYNPFNTTQGGEGTTSVYSNLTGGGKIWNYKDWQSGLNATIATLTGAKAHDYHYDNIVSQLQSGKIKKGDEVSSAGFASWGQYDSIKTAMYADLPSSAFSGAPQDTAVVNKPVDTPTPTPSAASISTWVMVGAIILVLIFVLK